MVLIDKRTSYKNHYLNKLHPPEENILSGRKRDAQPDKTDEPRDLSRVAKEAVVVLRRSLLRSALETPKS
jgi:hypothetical protein